MATTNGNLPKIKLDRLLYTKYQHPSLERAHQFFLDFGLHLVEKTDKAYYYRGFGENPFVYVAERSPNDRKHFASSGWLVREYVDLETASQLPNSSKIQASIEPGGGSFVDLVDPNGVNIRLHHGIALRAKVDMQPDIPKPVHFNSWTEKPRKGEFQRFDTGPSKVHKLGHFGIVVDQSKFDSSVEWYLDTFTLMRTDSLYDQKSGQDTMTFMHIDKGEEYTDHHTFFVQSPPVPVAEPHAHHSSFEIDDMDSQLMGHYHLQEKGWTNCWGVGRHLLGSQIFDYWFDPSGNIVEHYSDGDLVNNKTEHAREPAAPQTIAVWGPNVTLAFLTTHIEDVGKSLPPPPAPKAETAAA